MTPDIFYENESMKGGDLILDLGVFAWDSQPTRIYIESPLLTTMYTFDDTDMIPVEVNGKVATYHCEIPVDNLSSSDDSEFWVICENDGFDYTNAFGVLNLAGTDSLAAMFRFGLYVSPVRYNYAPIIDSGVDGETEPREYTVETYTVTAHDPDPGDVLSYYWTVTDLDSGLPVEGFDQVQGDPDGSFDLDWGLAAGTTWHPTPYDVDCTVSDGEDETQANTLTATVYFDGTKFVSNHPDFASLPENGTQTGPYHSVLTACTLIPSGSNDIVLVDYGTGTYSGDRIYLYNKDYLTIRGWSWYTDPGGRPEIIWNTDVPIVNSMDYSDHVTIQGLKFSLNSSRTQSNLMWATYANYLTVKDCFFTGQANSSPARGLILVVCHYPNIENNLIKDLYCMQSTSNVEGYGITVNSGYSPWNVSNNEITRLADTNASGGVRVWGMMLANAPNTATIRNNLVHHIEPKPGSGVTNGLLLIGMEIQNPNATVELANNAVDNLSGEYSIRPSGDLLRGMYISDSGPTLLADSFNNIVTNLTGQSTVSIVGFYHTVDGQSDYCDAWNIEGSNYYGIGAGPNSISADPEYVNNTSEPYDYHLNAGSPCIGTGKNDWDMGCYGNLEPGEKVGLLTPE